MEARNLLLGPRDEFAVLAAPPTDPLLVAQYQSLRAEIISIRENVVKLATLGITGLPALAMFADEGSPLAPVLYVGPVIVTMFMFFLMTLQNGLLRAGHFIQVYIESDLVRTGHVGWERYLDGSLVNRRPDLHFALALTSVHCLYYVGSVYLAFSALQREFHAPFAGYLCGAYLLMFLLSLAYGYRNLRWRNGNERGRHDGPPRS